MPAQISSKSGKVKKSKLEKIFELETELKVIKAENYRLRKAVTEKEKQDEQTCSSSSSSDPDGNPASESQDQNMKSPEKSPKLPRKSPETSKDAEKLGRLKEAFTALKNVTISQEKSLHSMRQKAQERRKEILKKDKEINALKKKVVTLQKIQGGLAKAKCPDALQAELEELQEAFFDEQTTTAKLELKLQEKDKTIASLQTVLQAKAKATRRGSELSSKASTHGNETQYLKKELGKKSKQLVELQEQLETMAEELHEAKMKARESVSTCDISESHVSELHVSESEFYDGTSRGMEDEYGQDYPIPELDEGVDPDDLEPHDSFTDDDGTHEEGSEGDQATDTNDPNASKKDRVSKKGDDYTIATAECYIVD